MRGSDYEISIQMGAQWERFVVFYQPLIGLARDMHKGVAMEQELYASDYQNGLSCTIRLLLSKGLMKEEAEELAQAAWVRGWEAKHQLQQTERVIPWVNSIAINAMYNQKRRAKRMEQLDDNRAVMAAPVSVPAKIDAAKLLDRCSPLDRSLILHRFVGGYVMSEIAKIHGISTVATRVRIHRAKAALRRYASKPRLTEAAA